MFHEHQVCSKTRVHFICVCIRFVILYKRICLSLRHTREEQVCTQTVLVEDCNALLASESEQFACVLRVFRITYNIMVCAVPDRRHIEKIPTLKRLGRLCSLANYTLVYPLITHELSYLTAYVGDVCNGLAYKPCIHNTKVISEAYYLMHKFIH